MNFLMRIAIIGEVITALVAVANDRFDVAQIALLLAIVFLLSPMARKE